MDIEMKTKIFEILTRLKGISKDLNELGIDAFNLDIIALRRGLVGIIVNDDVNELYITLGGD